MDAIDLAYQVFQFAGVLLGHSGVHDFFVDHAEGIFLLNFVNDAIVGSMLLLVFKCLLLQVLVIEIFHHVGC